MSEKKGAIIIPARYASTRFPGKPLTPLLGKSMLLRVYEIAKSAIHDFENVEVYITTDDARIEQHAKDFGATVLMTDEHCKTGSDRVYQAANQLKEQPDYVLNLQGDAPLTPPAFVKAILYELMHDDNADVVTPITQLDWPTLDKLREQKKETPFSGTTVIKNQDGYALWFSKHIIPALRTEAKDRTSSTLSPIFRHIGLYGFQFRALKEFVSLEEGVYERLEGLEQLRMLENGMHIKTVSVDYDTQPAMNGIDTIEDAKRCEALLQGLAH